MTNGMDVDLEIKQKGGNMNRYTNFILTVIAVAMIGILFKGQIIKAVKADMAPVNYEILVRMEDKVDYIIGAVESIRAEVLK